MNWCIAHRMRLRLHETPADANQIYPYDRRRKQIAAARDGGGRRRDRRFRNRAHPRRARRAGYRVRAESTSLRKNRRRAAAMARQAAPRRVRGNQQTPRPSQHRIRAADPDGPRARFRGSAHALGPQRHRAGARRMARSPAAGRRRRPVHRSRPRLSEPAHLLVQPLPRENLRRPALRADARRDRHRRRPRLDRRGQSAANRNDARPLAKRAASRTTCCGSSARASSRCSPRAG